MSEEAAFFRVSSAVKAIGLDNGYVELWHADHDRSRYLNETGAFVWRRLDGSRSIERIAQELHQEVDADPAQLAHDVGELVSGLVTQGYACVSRSHAPVEVTGAADGPRNLDISVTGHCNIRCKYCFYAYEMQKRGDLPLEEWTRFFEELRQLPVRSIQLSGGEVFSRPDVFELVDRLLESRVRIKFLTNGMLITPDVIDQLLARRQRVSSLQVSIDGATADAHGKSRSGPKTFGPAIGGVRLLHEAGLPVMVRVTITRHNVRELPEIAHLLLEDIGISYFTTNEAQPVGLGQRNSDKLSLRADEQLEAMKLLVALTNKYGKRIQGNAGPLFKAKQYAEMERARYDGEKMSIYPAGCLSACGCVYASLAVHHDGIVSACNFLEGSDIGRINVDPLRELWASSRLLREMKERRKLRMDELPECRGCEWADTCNGSCPSTGTGGSLTKANIHDCFKRFLADSEPHRRYRTFREELAHGVAEIEAAWQARGDSEDSGVPERAGC